jgi:hypothetical protein
MKACGGVDGYILVFLTSVLLVVGGEWSASCPSRFTQGERAPGTHWVDPRAGLDEVEKRKFLTILGLELRHLGRPARSQSLYRMRYPGSTFWLWGHLKLWCISADHWLRGINVTNRESQSEDSSETRHFRQNVHLCVTRSWKLCWNAWEPHRASAVEITWTSPISPQALFSGRVLTGAHLSTIRP